MGRRWRSGLGLTRLKAAVIVALAVAAVSLSAAIIFSALRTPGEPPGKAPVPGVKSETVATVPATAAVDPVVPADQLRARLLLCFRDPEGALAVPQFLADDWTDALLARMEDRRRVGLRPLTESQLKTIRRGMWQSWSGIGATTHPLHYVLVREQMLKRVGDYLERYEQELVSRPAAAAQMRELVDQWADDLRARFPEAKEAIEAARRGRIIAELLATDNPFAHSFRRPATEKELEALENVWSGTDSTLVNLERQARADKQLPTADNFEIAMAHMFLLHGCWDRIPVPDAPELIAAKAAFDDKADQIKAYEAAQEKEAGFSRAEEYTPPLAPPLRNPPPAPPVEVWGDEAHGIQVRLLAERTTLPAGEMAVLVFQVRNNGQEAIKFHTEPANAMGLALRDAHGHELEVDGTRYIYSPFADPSNMNGIRLSGGQGFGDGIDGSPIRPGHRSVRREVRLDYTWRDAKPGASYKELQAAPALTLSPGEHKIRFVYLLDSGATPAREAISNTITLTIGAAATAPATGPATGPR